MKITIIAGARPNFMKIAPIIHAIHAKQKQQPSLQYRLVHTGQHYDSRLSESFFEDLGIPTPHANLEVGSASHAVQTAHIMIRFEQELLANPTDLVLVVGDVNSTMACTLVAKKMDTKVAHVEAGLRSFDMDMPEEVNRLVTDILADYFFTTSRIAGGNLNNMGIPEERIWFVGNVMIDTLKRNLQRLERPSVADEHKLLPQEYLVMTLHRPSNVDDAGSLHGLLRLVAGNVGNRKIVFPVHPRTLARLDVNNLPSNITLTDPLRYLQFIYLVRNSLGVVTDSGGIQEETTSMEVPCLTLRENTERPETIVYGTNELLGSDAAKIKEALQRLTNGQWKKGSQPELWDGLAAERIVDILAALPS